MGIAAQRGPVMWKPLTPLVAVLVMVHVSCDRVLPHGHPRVDAGTAWVTAAYELGEAFLRRKEAGELNINLAGARFWAQFIGEVPASALAGPCKNCRTIVEYQGTLVSIGFMGPTQDSLSRLARPAGETPWFIGRSLNTLNRKCPRCDLMFSVITDQGAADFIYYNDLSGNLKSLPWLPFGSGCSDPRFRNLIR